MKEGRRDVINALGSSCHQLNAIDWCPDATQLECLDVEKSHREAEHTRVALHQNEEGGRRSIKKHAGCDGKDDQRHNQWQVEVDRLGGFAELNRQYLHLRHKVYE